MRLRQAAFDRFPLGGWNNPRQQIVRENPLGSFIAAVNREGDALVEKREIGFLLGAPQLFGGQAQQA